VELDVSAQAWAQRQQQAARLATARAPHLERLRSAAASGERQCRHGDPAHRHVAAALEHAGEVALQALKQAEAAAKQRAQARTPPAHALPPARHAACRAIGQRLPALWSPKGLSPPQRKALLRCLIDKVVIQRVRRAQMHTRMVWRGGATTTVEVPVAGGARTALPGAPAMAQPMRVLCAEGTSDDEMARQWTQHGYRSPSRPAVLPSTGKGIRLKLGLMQNRSPAHPRQIAGSLTVPPRAAALGITPHWGYDQRKRGTVMLQRDAHTRLSLFPDCPETLAAFGPLRAGEVRARHD
jgi:hypothetical protein